MTSVVSLPSKGHIIIITPSLPSVMTLSCVVTLGNIVTFKSVVTLTSVVSMTMTGVVIVTIL